MTKGLDYLVPPRTGFFSPYKGTRAREIILLALAPRGLSASAAIQKRLIPSQQALLTFMQRLEYDCGFDIRLEGSKKSKDPTTQIYRIVGRHRWNGQYRRFRPSLDRNVRGA